MYIENIYLLLRWIFEIHYVFYKQYISIQVLVFPLEILDLYLDLIKQLEKLIHIPTLFQPYLNIFQ